MTTRDLALRALVTKHVADVATAAICDRRADLAGEMANGDRTNVVIPDEPGLDLGYVLRTKPKGHGAVTDRTKFTAWMRTNYPDNVETVATIPPENFAAAIRVVRRHAPHLLTETLTVRAWAEREVIQCTERAKEPCGPGGELDIPGVTYEPAGPGVITVKLSAEGPAAIERLWRQGRIDLRSGQVLELHAKESP